MSLDELDALLLTLARADVRFVVIGGIASACTGMCAAPRTSTSAPSLPADNLHALADHPARARRTAGRGRRLRTGASSSRSARSRRSRAGRQLPAQTPARSTRRHAMAPRHRRRPRVPNAFGRAVTVDLRGAALSVCSLAHLRLMKETAGVHRTFSISRTCRRSERRRHEARRDLDEAVDDGSLEVARKTGLGGVVAGDAQDRDRAGVMSPLRSKRKLPSRPSFTRLALSCSSTDARVPSERAIAGRRAPPPAPSRARSRCRPRRSPSMKRSAAGSARAPPAAGRRWPRTARGGRPGALEHVGTSRRGSRPRIVTRVPSRARRAFSSRSPPWYGSAPSTTPSAPERAIRSASASKLFAPGSNAVVPAIGTPSFRAA